MRYDSSLDRVGENIVIRVLRKADSEEDIEQIFHEAKDMAIRAFRAQQDSSWWTIVGQPHHNERMERIRRKMENKD